jgi:GT2 family glycosyltransferase
VQHRHRQWLNPMIRRLNRRGTMFGDQSVFARRAVFEKIGGFKDMPLMEDVDFSRRLRLAGKVVLLDPPLMSSSRRHLVHGQVRTSIENFVLLWLFKFGVSPHMLHRWYYRRAAKIMSR